MKALIIAVLSLLLAVGLLFGGVYAFFMYSLKNMHKKQIIAENIQITSEWIEIKPEKALETTKLAQEVQLLIEGYKHDIQKNDFGNIQLEDGTYIKPEVEIVDENGKIYQLKEVSRLGDLIGFCPNEKTHGTFRFPQNVTYKTIRISSSKPFICKKIIWYDFDLK